MAAGPEGGMRRWTRTALIGGLAVLRLGAAADAHTAQTAIASPPAQVGSSSAMGDLPPPEAPEVVRRDDQGRTTVRATRISTPIRVDGVLDEEVYRRVKSIGGFIQQEPHFGDPATEFTEAWIFFDEKNIYISARCQDSHPERMVVTEMRRDNNNIIQNENFSVNFDTFHDRRNGFLFQTTPLGALRDALITDEGNPNNDWNTIWDSKTVRDDKGWTVEIVVPFKSLRYAAGTTDDDQLAPPIPAGTATYCLPRTGL